MYLRALEIQGFKSFPDKTVLNFGEDITAIVGPNGSGKSNISDAIRWVMGEQSTKSLRGAKMEDVIFGGTERRAQVGFAQVTLVIDNTEHIFPTMEEAEVAVTRRYYRSGESEYYINRQSVRLKDVYELFLDTGMGKEGYSIIGQGKIDEILSVKSGERREVFEEAAGISKYRHRKEEAERKLERTDENLVRINDKIAELELQVEPLRDQAEKAKRYLVLRDEMRLIEISVWLENLEALKADARQIESDFREAEADRDRAREELNRIYAQIERCTEQMQEKDIEAERLRTRVSETEGEIHEEEAQAAVLEEGVRHSRETIERIDQELAEQELRSGSMQTQIDAQTQRLAEIDQRCDQLRREMAELLRQAEEAAQQAGGAQSQAEALRAKEAMAVAAAADCRAEVSALGAENRELSERREALAQELQGFEEQLKESEAAAAENRRALEEAREEAEAVANVIAGHSMRMDERRRRLSQATDKRMKLTVDVGAMDNRIRLLEEMEKEYEGFSKAVRLVMQGSLRGIHGPVANLMNTEESYSVAIEVALGAGLQNIVVDREEDAKSAIGYLKRREGGRATFLPLSAIRGEVLREAGVEQEYGFVGIASDLVRYDAKYRQIFLNLLGRTVVAEDLDCGIAIARKYHNRFRIVTLDGQVINRGGSMTGGSVSRNAGVLSRAGELKRLRAEVEGLHQKLEQAKSAEESASRELSAAQYEVEVAEGQKRQAEDAVLRLEGSRDHYRILIENLRQSVENAQGEAIAINGRIEDNGEKTRQAEQEQARQEELAGQYRAQAEALLTGQSEFLERGGKLSEEISYQKSEIAALCAEREATDRALQDLCQLRQQITGDQGHKETLRRQYQESIDSSEEKIKSHQAAAEALRQQEQALQEQLSTIREEKIAIEAQRTAQNKAGQEQNETLLNLERSASRLEQKISAAAIEEKQILDRLWERYELSHSDAQAQRIEIESLPKANRRIAELKRDIGALGTPNIGAIEEFERVNTRYTYLSEQRNDVEQAKEELTGIIDEITREMTEIFAEQFKLLNESFQETFLELFGGGQAHLELEDEDDILNCGIDIKVQPPGKSLKTITLLSGGEKAFVAIALYFSILKVHPTPFCVMDEIEAALDDANVTRFAKYMRRIAGRTQFIVITHRRGTMEEADVLYGVTMQERGVSKILTINLNDLTKELKIK